MLEYLYGLVLLVMLIVAIYYGVQLRRKDSMEGFITKAGCDTCCGTRLDGSPSK